MAEILYPVQVTKLNLSSERVVSHILDPIRNYEDIFILRLEFVIPDDNGKEQKYSIGPIKVDVKEVK